MTARLFQNTTKQEKISFFLNCQDILIKHHPKSVYLFRKDNITERMNQINDLISKYKGYIYQEENLCVLFNTLMIKKPNDSLGDIKANMFKPPAHPYNTIIIDFAAFRALKDCLNFCRQNQTQELQYAVYVKNNQPHIYNVQKLVKKMLKLPVI